MLTRATRRTSTPAKGESVIRLSHLFVVRDALIHSHVWVQKFALSEAGGRRFIAASRKDWSGNKRLEQRLNSKTYRTRLLRFNAIPSRMDRTAVVKAFDVVLAAMHSLGKSGANPIPIFPFQVQHQGRRLSFEALPKCLADARDQLPSG